MRIYLAPMEGVTGSIVRNAFLHHFGHIDKYFTPFIPAAKRLSPKIKKDISAEANEGITLIPQLISNRSDEVLSMIGILKDYGYREFNINLGCPSGTVSGKKRGSGLLLYPEELDSFLYGIYEKADVPISVKTRIGFNSPDEWPLILDIYKRYPISELIIHPRVKKEMYSGNVHLDAFQPAYDHYTKNRQDRDSLSASSGNTLLVYNGDIRDMESFGKISSQFPLTDTFMIGRGLLARPDLCCRIKGVEVPDTRGQICAFVQEIYDGYAAIFSGEKDVVMHMKEIWASLADSFEDSGRLLKKLMKSHTAGEYNAVVSQIFDTLELSRR